MPKVLACVRRLAGFCRQSWRYLVDHSLGRRTRPALRARASAGPYRTAAPEATGEALTASEIEELRLKVFELRWACSVRTAAGVATRAMAIRSNIHSSSFILRSLEKSGRM